MIVTVLSQIYKCGCNRGIAKIEKTQSITQTKLYYRAGPL